MKRLYIDLEQCAKCEDCEMKCSYNLHPRNIGINRLREIANFALVCRRCEDAPCVSACPWEALEKNENKILWRYSMRCTSCKSCSNACPFGTIYPETIPFVFRTCDFCINRLKANEEPVCVSSCPHGGVKFIDLEEDVQKNIYKISDNLVVYSTTNWVRNGTAAGKK